MNWGEAYLDHYERFVGPLKGQRIFAQDNSSPRIQILEFHDYDDELSIFATLGMTHYIPEIGRPAEICCLADTALDEVQGLLAQAAFYIIQRRMQIGWGISISHQQTDPAFSERYGKSSLYITNGFGFPDAFRTVICNGQSGRMYQAFFISPAEHEFFCEHGAVAFENRINASGGDLVDLRRIPCV